MERHEIIRTLRTNSLVLLLLTAGMAYFTFRWEAGLATIAGLILLGILLVMTVIHVLLWLGVRREKHEGESNETTA